MTVTFIGHGYVGLVTASIFAELGNKVWVIGHTEEKIENLKKGIIPIYEPGLEEIVKRNVEEGRLLFTLEYDQAIPDSSVIFIAVGTPPKENGEADLTTVLEVAEKLAKNLGDYSVVVTKSTVPLKTNRVVKEIIEKNKKEESRFDVASVPEFLREGQAIKDTLEPDRIVIGTDSEEAKQLLLELHKPIKGEVILTNIETAEMIKYAANAFLATKISFANAIAQLSEKTGADGLKVLEGIGYDKRIGKFFLSPGAGYGGSCFPKDIKALINISKNAGYSFSLLEEVEKINEQAMDSIADKARDMLIKTDGKKVSVLGLSFKPDTDDMRDAPSIEIIKKLLEQGFEINVYDPVAMDNAKKLIEGVTFSQDPLSAIEGTEVLIIVTEWDEFKKLDLVKVKEIMAKPNLVDGRNIFDPLEAKKIGFNYIGVGR
jgi:UDPglucose 6-dehydrogenase